MSLEQKVNEAIKTAMKERNEPELRGLRAIKSAILLIKTSENPKDELTEAEETKLLQKLAKQRKDSLEIYRQQKREDLAKKEEEEIAVIERFLPKQMDENDIKIALTGIMEEAGASSPADMGRVMALAMNKLSGKADGKTISRIVKELLAKG